MNYVWVETNSFIEVVDSTANNLTGVFSKFVGFSTVNLYFGLYTSLI